MAIGRVTLPSVGLQPGAAGTGHLQLRVLADEVQVAVAGEGSGQQSKFSEHLEAVADAQHPAAAGGEIQQRLQHRCEAGDRSTAQIVAVAEAARQDHRLQSAQVGVFMPEPTGGHAETALGCPLHIPVAVGAGEHHDTDAHGFCSSGDQSSITGLASS